MGNKNKGAAARLLKDGGRIDANSAAQLGQSIFRFAILIHFLNKFLTNSKVILSSTKRRITR